MNKYRIRRPHLSDIPALAAIWEESVAATHDFLSQEDFEYYSSRLQECFDGVRLFVFEYVGGPIAGFAGVRGDKIEMLFVGERGKGIGKILLDFAVGNLFAARVDVNAQNGAAVEFYRKYGFRETGSSATDAEGKPYPILHMEIKVPESQRTGHGHGHPNSAARGENADRHAGYSGNGHGYGK